MRRRDREASSPDASWFTVTPDGVELEILVVPRASRSTIVGLHDGRLRVKLAAPPADGLANDALVALLVSELDVKKSAVEIVSGHGSRNKRVRVRGVAADAVRRLVA